MADSLSVLPPELLVDLLLKFSTGAEVLNLVFSSKAWTLRLRNQEYLWRELYWRRTGAAPPPGYVGTLQDLYVRSARGVKLVLVGSTSLLLPRNASLFAMKKKVRFAQQPLLEDFELVVEQTGEVVGVWGNDFAPSNDAMDAVFAFAQRLGIAHLLPAPVETGWECTIAALPDSTRLEQVRCKPWAKQGWFLRHLWLGVHKPRFALDSLLIRPLLTSGLFVSFYRICRGLFPNCWERHLLPVVRQRLGIGFVLRFAVEVGLGLLTAVLPVVRASLRIELTRVIIRLLLAHWDVDFARERVCLHAIAVLREAACSTKQHALHYAVSSLAFWAVQQHDSLGYCLLLPQLLYSVPTAYCIAVVYISVENIKSQFDLYPL